MATMTMEAAQELDHQLVIRPFASADQVVAEHVKWFGPLGQVSAKAVLRWASLWPGVNPLDSRILLAPVELGPYNQHVGYTVSRRRQAHAPRYTIDFLVHDAGWYGAIEEAAPGYLGMTFPPECWTRQKIRDGRLTEVETCHWPHSFRRLIAQQAAASTSW